MRKGVKIIPNKKLIINWVKYDEENTQGYDVTNMFLQYITRFSHDVDININQLEFKNFFNINFKFNNLKVNYVYLST
jgi:hypothetical protein